MNLKIHKKIEKTNPNIKCIGSLKKDVYIKQDLNLFFYFLPFYFFAFYSTSTTSLQLSYKMTIVLISYHQCIILRPKQ